MTFLRIDAFPNGAHDNLTPFYSVPLPEGWAVLPESVGTPETLESFPFGDITVEEISGVMTVTSWTPGTIPAPEEKTPAQLREEAYNTEAVILWDGEMITVTAAAQLWQYYAAEGSPKADELQPLISYAKATIREKYPDVK